MKNYFKTKRRWEYFLQALARKTSGLHVRYCFKGIPWRATSGSPSKCVDIYRYTQEIRRYVWKVRMKRWMIKAHQRKCPLQRRYFKSKIRSQARYVQRLKKIYILGKGGAYIAFYLFRHVFVTISVAFPVQISLFWYGAKMLLIYTCRCEGGKDSYLTTSLFIVQFCREIF